MVVLAASASVVELVEEVDEGADEGLVREERLRLRRPQQRLVQDQLLVPQLVGVLSLDLQGQKKVYRLDTWYFVNYSVDQWLYLQRPMPR